MDAAVPYSAARTRYRITFITDEIVRPASEHSRHFTILAKLSFAPFFFSQSTPLADHSEAIRSWFSITSISSNLEKCNQTL